MKNILIFLFLIITLVYANPCENLNEQECVNSYNQGYQTSNECNSMFYCYPEYNNEIFQNCQIITRTNFSDCSNSFSTCYNNLAIDETQFKKCFCDEGIEFKKIDECANIVDWSGICIDKSSCKEITKTYLGREVIHYECDILEEEKDIDCESLTHTEEKCKNNFLITYEQTYKPNECGTKCILNKIQEIKREECDICQNSECTFNPVTISSEKKEESMDIPINNNEIMIKNETQNKSKININKETNEPIFSDKKIEVKIRKNVPTELITILLSFISLFLIGLLFLIKTN